MFGITRRTLVFALSLALGLALGFAVPDTASAGTPFDGKILTSKKRIPTSANSKKAYFAKLRKQKQTRFQEDTKKKQWKIYFAAFFKRPINDLEVTVKLYDVTDKKPHLRSSFESYLSERGQTNLISYLELDREKFGVNRRIMMVVEHRGRKLAQSTFEIRGEAEKFSGKVDFSDEETQ